MYHWTFKCNKRQYDLFTLRQFVNKVFSSVTSIQFFGEGDNFFHVMSAENKMYVTKDLLRNLPLQFRNRT